jgi:NADPH:quinone reductase-like Zn-dependent oxidoreductase
LGAGRLTEVSVPATMGAILTVGIGGFEQLVWRNDVAVPSASDGDVLIRVSAAAVNNTDINTRIGWYAKDITDATSATGEPTAASGRDDIGWGGNVPQFPRIQGADACGEVVAVGRGVSPDRIGQRVLVEPVFRRQGAPLESGIYFGSEVDGGFAEFTACA